MLAVTGILRRALCMAQFLMTAQCMVGANTVRPFCLQSHLRYLHIANVFTNHVRDGALDLPFSVCSIFCRLLINSVNKFAHITKRKNGFRKSDSETILYLQLMRLADKGDISVIQPHCCHDF